MSDDETLINPRTGRPVTRIVRARHRDLTREVIERRTSKTITILAHNFNPEMHAALDYARPATNEVKVDRKVAATPKRNTLRKATKRKRKKKS